MGQGMCDGCVLSGSSLFGPSCAALLCCVEYVIPIWLLLVQSGHGSQAFLQLPAPWAWLLGTPTQQELKCLVRRGCCAAMTCLLAICAWRHESPAQVARKLARRMDRFERDILAAVEARLAGLPADVAAQCVAQLGGYQPQRAHSAGDMDVDGAQIGAATGATPQHLQLEPPGASPGCSAAGARDAELAWQVQQQDRAAAAASHGRMGLQRPQPAPEAAPGGRSSKQCGGPALRMPALPAPVQQPPLHFSLQQPGAPGAAARATPALAPALSHEAANATTGKVKRRLVSVPEDQPATPQEIATLDTPTANAASPRRSTRQRESAEQPCSHSHSAHETELLDARPTKQRKQGHAAQGSSTAGAADRNGRSRKRQAASQMDTASEGPEGDAVPRGRTRRRR